MTTQDNDPFAVTPEAAPPSTPEPAATPPGVLTPGVLPGAAPAAPPLPGAPGAPAAFPTYAPVSPAGGVARWAIITTGAYTLLSLITAALAPSTLERTKQTLADPANASIDATSTLVSMVTFGVAVASYVMLALWMWRIRGNLTALGRKPGGPPAVEWWGWFIPVANLVLPFLGMRAITKGIVGSGRLVLWWLPFAATTLVGAWSAVTQFTAVDFVTGEIVNEAALDATVGAAITTAALVLVSWIFLVTIINKTTKEHAPNAQ